RASRSIASKRHGAKSPTPRRHQNQIHKAILSLEFLATSGIFVRIVPSAKRRIGWCAVRIVLCVVEVLRVLVPAVEAVVRVAIRIIIRIEGIDRLQSYIQQTGSQEPPGWRDREATEIQRQPEQIAQDPQVAEPR